MFIIFLGFVTLHEQKSVHRISIDYGIYMGCNWDKFLCAINCDIGP